MATRILIPTPLRPYTDKKDAVEAEGATVGELLAHIANFRLNAKHLDVQFADGSRWERRFRRPRKES